MIVRFADYGFPRAHAAAYGVLAFQTAYLKAHYPVQFMASMLTAVMGSHRKVAEYVVECRRMDMAVLPPDVNESGVLFTPLQQGNIRFGLAAIKNVGTQAMESILAVRKERPFDSLLDFCRRVDLRVCNKRVIESLIQAGAFDSLPGHRAQLLAMLDETVDAAVKWRKERDDLQIDMFGFVEMPNWDIEYPEVPKFSAGQQLELERELLGLYLSGHPLDDFETLLESTDAERLMELGDVPDEAVVVTAGMVVSLKTITTKQGKAMAFIELEDQIERCEVVLFPEVWKRSHQWIEKGALLAFRAKMQHQDEHFKLLADEAAPLAEDSLARLLQRRRAGARSSAAAGKPASATGSAAGGGRTPRVPSSPSAAESSAQPTTAPAVPPAAAARPGTGTSPHVSEAAPGEQASAPRGWEPTARQRVFVKITRQAEEDASLLVSLKALLQEHPGALPTVLFYESSQRLLALSDAYSIKPSPQLFDRMESMLGAGTVKVK